MNIIIGYHPDDDGYSDIRDVGIAVGRYRQTNRKELQNQGDRKEIEQDPKDNYPRNLSFPCCDPSHDSGHNNENIGCNAERDW